MVVDAKLLSTGLEIGRITDDFNEFLAIGEVGVKVKMKRGGTQAHTYTHRGYSTGNQNVSIVA